MLHKLTLRIPESVVMSQRTGHFFGNVGNPEIMRSFSADGLARTFVAVHAMVRSRSRRRPSGFAPPLPPVVRLEQGVTAPSVPLPVSSPVSDHVRTEAMLCC
jgi:hypothetical protein